MCDCCRAFERNIEFLDRLKETGCSQPVRDLWGRQSVLTAEGQQMHILADHPVDD